MLYKSHRLHILLLSILNLWFNTLSWVMPSLTLKYLGNYHHRYQLQAAYANRNTNIAKQVWLYSLPCPHPLFISSTVENYYFSRAGKQTSHIKRTHEFNSLYLPILRNLQKGLNEEQGEKKTRYCSHVQLMNQL